MIVVEGSEIWAYVGAGKIEAYSAPPGVPIRATIDGAEHVIRATRIGAASFEADIIGVIQSSTAAADLPAKMLPKAPHLDEEPGHDE
jgi:hypothetical protein